MKKVVFMMSVAFMIQSCSYAISPGLEKKADTSIPFDQIEMDPELYKGTLVILGGIIEKSNNIDNGTLIEVSQRPLDHWGKPLTRKQSAGRFMVLYTGYLDVLVYGPGRDITVAGVIEGVRQKGLTDGEHAYPVILSKELKLWPKERQSWTRPQYLDPLYDPRSSPRQYYSPREY